MKKLIVSIVAVGLLAGCGAGTPNEGEDKTIRIGASTTPHAEIIKQVIPTLESQGYKVDLKQFTDYVTPNKSLVDNELDVNFFQHAPYLEEWAAKAGASDKVANVFSVHFEPLGIYSVKHTSLKDINDGQTIAIPNDPTNGGRALQLLEANGIIKLKEGKGISAKVNDIESYTKDIKIKELAAEACATSIKDVDFSVINGNNALNAKLIDNVLATEDKDSAAAKEFANIIVAQKGHEKDAKVTALIDALNTEDVKNYIDKTFNGIVVPLVPTK